ncbi:hypothetical protein ThvES_00001280 [Thiovulum sp. ES]|nr:hypothetical protein ThvES_00001280 [Thiovulum sp. ES]
MFNILVADSFEDDLNQILFLIEDFKAKHPEFDYVINIIEAHNIENAREELSKNKIDICYVSHDMDEIAFETYKKDKKTIIVSIGGGYEERLKNWYVGNFQKPFKNDTFEANLRSYLDILFFKKSGISAYKKIATYDFALHSNLHLFWQNHFSTRTSLNEVIQLIYNLAIYEIDNGRSTSLNIIETDKDMTFVFNTGLSGDFLRYLNKIKRHIAFKISEDDRLVFRVFFIDYEFDLLVRDYEDFAIDYLDYNQTHILDTFIFAHDDELEHEEIFKELEVELNADEVTSKTVRKYLGRKTNKANLHYSFMSSDDLITFDEILSSLHDTVKSSEGSHFSSEELFSIIDSYLKLSQLFMLYNGSKDISKRLKEFSDQVLFNEKIVRDHDENFVIAVSKVNKKFSDWYKALKERTDHFDKDLRDETIIKMLDDIIDSFK